MLGTNIRFLRTRWLVTLAALLPILSSCGRTQTEDSSSLESETVHLLDEPRHRTVYHEGDLYLLDVQLNPGDESLEHIHDQAILLTRLSSSSGPLKGEVSSITEYASSPFTHSIRNQGDYLLRILALVNSSLGSVQQDDSPCIKPIISFVIVLDSVLIGIDFSCIVLPKLRRPVCDKKITSVPVYCTVSRSTQPIPATVSANAIGAGA